MMNFEDKTKQLSKRRRPTRAFLLSWPNIEPGRLPFFFGRDEIDRAAADVAEKAV